VYPRSWKDKKEAIEKSIRRISHFHGGDDPQWLNEYILDVIEQNKNDLQKAVDCFKLIEDSME